MGHHNHNPQPSCLFSRIWTCVRTKANVARMNLAVTQTLLQGLHKLMGKLFTESTEEKNQVSARRRRRRRDLQEVFASSRAAPSTGRRTRTTCAPRISPKARNQVEKESESAKMWFMKRWRKQWMSNLCHLHGKSELDEVDYNLDGGPHRRPRGKAPVGKLWDSHHGAWIDE